MMLKMGEFSFTGSSNSDSTRKFQNARLTLCNNLSMSYFEGLIVFVHDHFTLQPRSTSHLKRIHFLKIFPKKINLLKNWTFPWKIRLTYPVGKKEKRHAQKLSHLKVIHWEVVAQRESPLLKFSCWVDIWWFGKRKIHPNDTLWRMK